MPTQLSAFLSGTFTGYTGSSGSNGFTGSAGTDFFVTDDTATDATRYLTFADTTSGTTSTYVASTKLYFNPNTGVLNATEFNSLSDVAFKENVQQISNEEKLSIFDVQPVSFNWRDTGKKAYGIVAQQVESVYPGIVSSTNGNKSVSYNQIIALLLATVQDQQKQIDSLQQQISKE